MFSPEFLKRYAEIQQKRVNQAATAETDVEVGASSDPVEQGQKMIGTRPSAYANTTPSVVDAIVYDPTSGKAFPNPSVAVSEGVTNFSYQVPSGMNIDWSYWDKFKTTISTPYSSSTA